MEFMDKVVLVTGASSGIGRQTALAFARRGARLGVLARTEGQLEEVAGQIRGLGGRCLCLAGDIRDRPFVEWAVRETERQLGEVDILVNNAGMGVGGAVYETSLEDIRYQVEVNILGVIHAAQAVLPSMMRRRTGMLINISSIVGKAAIPYSGFYCASKFAVTALSDAWRLELLPHGIHVLNVCPGATSGTSFHRNRRGPDSRLPHAYQMTAEQVAHRILAAAAQRRREIVLTGRGRLLVLAQRLAPGLTFLALSRVIPYLRGRSGRGSRPAREDS